MNPVWDFHTIKTLNLRSESFSVLHHAIAAASSIFFFQERVGCRRPPAKIARFLSFWSSLHMIYWGFIGIWFDIWFELIFLTFVLNTALVWDHCTWPVPDNHLGWWGDLILLIEMMRRWFPSFCCLFSHTFASFSSLSATLNIDLCCVDRNSEIRCVLLNFLFFGAIRFRKWNHWMTGFILYCRQVTSLPPLAEDRNYRVNRYFAVTSNLSSLSVLLYTYGAFTAVLLTLCVAVVQVSRA